MLSTQTMKKIWKLMALGKQARDMFNGYRNEPSVKISFGELENRFNLEFTCHSLDWHSEIDVVEVSEKELCRALDKAIKRADKQVALETKEQKKEKNKPSHTSTQDV